MATSLLATGITTEDAYRLASLIQQQLHESNAAHVTTPDLISMAATTLEGQPDGLEIATRWLAWRAAKRSGRPVIIALAGAPGAGKSTFATRLAVRLGITRVVTTDTLREVLRTVLSPVQAPELHRSAFELVDTSAAEPFADFDRQCVTVSAATTAVARGLATEHRSMIAEGVHLLPGVTSDALAEHPARPIIVERIVTASDEQHAAHLRRREHLEPLRAGHRHVDAHKQIRAIQRHLIAIARDQAIPEIDQSAVSEMTQRIADEIVARIDEPTVSP